MNCLSEVKDFDEICTRKSEQKGMKLHTTFKIPTGKMQILQFKPVNQMPGIWEEMCQVQQDEPLQRSVHECKRQ